MSTFKQKTIIRSYKLRLQDKLKAVTEETENATSFLNNCVEEFRQRVQHILEIKDEKCLSLYRKLTEDLESYSEKLFILQSSFGEATEDESESSEDEEEADRPQGSAAAVSSNTEPKVLSVSSQNENSSQASSCPENSANVQNHENVLQRYIQTVNLQFYPEENVDIQKYAEENVSDQRCQEGSPEYNCHEEDGSNLTEDDFYSLNSENNVQNTNSCTFSSLQSQVCHNELISGKERASSVSVSRSSYRSISSLSNISEPLAVYKEIKTSHFVETSDEYSLETLDTNLVIQTPNFEILTHFSGTLSYIIDPGSFWIQIENSDGYQFSFPKSENAHLKSLSSIKKGSYCLAPFKSGPFYYRAQSLSDGKSGKELVKVLFIDHGSTQEIFVCDLKPLPRSAYDVSTQAVHCYLYGIAPTMDSWSHECSKRFKDFQKNCIDAVVKSKGSLYGVELVAKLSAELDEDFSVDIAQALCLDGLAVSHNESQSPDHYESQLPEPVCNDRIDSSLNVSGSYDINAMSNDSGVSVTSAYRSSQISDGRNVSGHTFPLFFHKVSEDYILSVTAKPDNDLVDLKPAMQMQDLILFESSDALDNIQSSSEALKTASKSNSSSSCCHLCRNKNFCLHLEVPPPSLLFVEKDMVIVMLSHIVNPHEFYVNMAMEGIGSLDDLREQMTFTYESEKNFQKIEISDLTEGMFCAGCFNADGYWYRVKIIQISPEDRRKDQILGQYIDYGNIAVIKCCHLRPLKTEFSKHPSFAIKCTLAGITPLNGARSASHSHWEEDAINCFKKLTSFERCLTAQICNELSNSQNDTYPVLLWDTEDSSDILINAQLAEQKVAVFDYSLLNPISANHKDIKKSHIDIDMWDPMVEEYYSTDNNYAFDDEDLEVMTAGYQAKDEGYTCKYFAMHDKCPRGENCKYKHLPLLETGVTHDQEEVYCLDSVPIISETVNHILVQVSAIITPSHFYVVLPFGCKTVDDIDNLVYQGSSYDQIINSEAKSLFEAIDKHYSDAPFNENTTVALSCGTIVAAKREWDEKWHRGRIIDVVDINKPSKVFFVDSGDYEWVPRKNIRTILPQFLHTSFQAVQCNLHGIEPVKSEKKLPWSKEAMNYFKDIVAGEILLAEIVHRFGQVYHVSLKKTSQNDHSNIAELLVSVGFAQYSKVKEYSDKRQTLYVPG